MRAVFLFLLILFGIGGYKYYEMEKRKEEQRIAERKARLERERKEAEIDSLLAEFERKKIEKDNKEAFVEKSFHSIAPAFFRAVRTECRTEFRDARKAGDRDSMEKALSMLYRYACEFVFCYGSDDNSKGVIGAVYDEAVNRVYNDRDIFAGFADWSYQRNGRIEGCRYLSEMDWKHFADVWPEVSGT